MCPYTCPYTTQAARLFTEEEIDAEALVELDRADFESLSVSKIGACVACICVRGHSVSVFTHAYMYGTHSVSVFTHAYK